MTGMIVVMVVPVVMPVIVAGVAAIGGMVVGGVVMTAFLVGFGAAAAGAEQGYGDEQGWDRVLFHGILGFGFFVVQWLCSPLLVIMAIR